MRDWSADLVPDGPEVRAKLTIGEPRSPGFVLKGKTMKNSLLRTLPCLVLPVIVTQTASGQLQGTTDVMEWLVPREKIFNGGPPKDGIPALTAPRFIPVSHAGYIDDEELVIGLPAGNQPRAYPHAILNWHEIVNDRMNDRPVSLTYCPLTGSGIAFPGSVRGRETTFGVSGLLYSSNLIAYDRATDSYWSQMRLLCVGGASRGTMADVLPAIETSWKTWKQMFPESEVLSVETGFRRDYQRYPYGHYKTSEYLLFDVDHEDRRLHRKERVLGVIVDELVRVYRIRSFGTGRAVIEDRLGELELVIAGSTTENFAVAYERQLADGTILSFQHAENAGTAVMIDSEGTSWNIFGLGIEGPRRGEQLTPTRSFIAYWFAWAAFYPHVEIYHE